MQSLLCERYIAPDDKASPCTAPNDAAPKMFLPSACGKFLMPRTPARFTQADVARVIRAINSTDTIMSVEITPDGVIRIVPYEPGEKRPVHVPKSSADIIL